MLNEAEFCKYLTQYLNDWKETTSDLFGEAVMNDFLRIKAGQFNLQAYKKQIKNRNKPLNYIKNDR